MTKIFISGINGFIGKALAKELLTQGYQVFGAGKSKDCDTENVTYTSCNVLDKNILTESSKDCDVFVHLAAVTAHDEIVNNAEQTLQINWQGTYNMLEAFTKNKGKHFIYASTGKVYGNFKSLPIKESDACNPLNILGKSKYICERLIDFFHKTNPEHKYSILRIFNIYGEEQKESFLVPTIIKQLKSDKISLGDIKAKRDYLYKDDLINAFLKVIESNGPAMDILNVGSGEAYSAEEITNTLGNILNKKITISSDIQKNRNDELDTEYCSNEKLKKLGWKQAYSLGKGLEATLNYYQ